MGTQEEKIFPASRSQIMNLKVALSLPDSCEISNTIYEEASWFFNLTVNQENAHLESGRMDRGILLHPSPVSPSSF